MRDKTNDISLKTLEEVVKTNGDEVVCGIVRFKKVKECAGYKKAKEMASDRFSKIKGGRIIADNRYAAVIRFRWFVFLVLFLLAGLAFFLISRNSTKAEVRPVGEYETVTQPEAVFDKIEPGMMDIPGFGDITLSEGREEIVIYNPPENVCGLKYTFSIGNNVLFESDIIRPGQERVVNFRAQLIKAAYRLTILTTGYDKDGTRLNSVVQNVILTVK